MNITHNVAAQVGASLGAAEHAWVAAVRDGATMMTTIMDAALDAKVPIGILNELVTEGLQGLNQIGAAGGTYAGLHSRLSALARRQGLEPSAYGESLRGMPPSSGHLVEVPRREAA